MPNQLIAPSRVLRDYLSNSLVWEDFSAQGGFVDGDIVVADPFKAGTTWTQRIVQQILQNGEEGDGGLSDTSPWLDSSWGDHAAMLATLKGQREAGTRWVMKSHLPADALPIAPEARYVFVGRNGKDLDHRTELSPRQVERFDRVALNKLGAACAHWLETGETSTAG
ncbi:sulfotransferase domain-containing protein [Mycobacterium sp. HUMS_1102779]|uniref:sulfotransferase domain-containing protein n=1 Tax=Mycobacterium sp. HUMS_1102779 TaxID=3383487 RepID=UPI00389AF32B